MNTDKFAFLTSPRFWQLFLVGLTAGLNEYQNSHDWIKALTIALSIWLGGSTIVRTIDRLAEPKIPPDLANQASKLP